MRLFLCTTIILLATLPSVFAQTLVPVGVPTNPSEAQATAITRSVITLALKLEPGDRLRVFDANAQTPIADLTVPKAVSDRARLRRMSGELARVPAYFKANGYGLQSDGQRIHLPRFIETVAGIVEPEHAEVRCLVFGSAFFGTGLDVRHDFGIGQFPSDGHVLCTSALSVYGTADKRKLRRARLDFVNLEPIEGDLDRFHVQRFWTVLARARGVTLTSWGHDATLAVEKLLRDLDDPFLPNVEIDTRDLRREIRRVNGPRLLPNIWTVAICIDASASMQHAFEQIRREIPVLAGRLYDAGATIRLAVIPFRQEPLPAFPLTTIRSEHSDGGRSIARLSGFLDGVVPTASQVDPNAALRAAMAMVDHDTHAQTYTCLVLVGDTRSERDGSEGRDQELRADLQAWIDQAGGRSLHAIYVGKPGAHDASQPFASLAAIDERPVLTGVGAFAEHVVEQAAKVTKGISPE